MLHVINQFSFVCHDKKKNRIALLSRARVRICKSVLFFKVEASFARAQPSKDSCTSVCVVHNSIILFRLLPNNAPTNVNIYLSHTLLNVTRKDAKFRHDFTDHLFSRFFLSMYYAFEIQRNSEIVSLSFDKEFTTLYTQIFFIDQHPKNESNCRIN